MAGAKSFGEFHYTKIGVKEAGKIVAKGRHNERGRETPNADPARSHENVRLAGSGDWLADVQARADEATFKRANSVLALDVAFFVSKGFFDDKPSAVMDVWARRTMEWMAQEFGGEKNVVAAILHKDETTPHIQALIVPLDEKDRLNARHFIGQPRQVVGLHTSYNKAVADLGLARGVQGSVATHGNIREWYAKIEAPTPARAEVERVVEVEPPRRLVGNPERYASEQAERIVERVTPALDAALVKAAHYEGQAAQAEANVAVLQQQVRALEQERAGLQRDYTALAAQVRSLDLRAVIERLGGAQDRHDKHKWRLDGEHISITGEKFYNHDRREGGGGAIDLVKHIIPGADFKQAVAYLSDEVGRELALSAAASYGARQAQEQAEQVIERLGRGERERGAFAAPAPNEGRWPQVRAYLVDERGLPARMVDALHERGDIYADGRSNAVFLRTDAEGQAVGASLRGTAPGSEFQGLARGSRRDEGHFSFALTLGKPDDPHDTPQYHLVESPIDALSRAALVRQAGETGRHAFISTDGQGELPRRQIDEALANRGLVRCGFDNDQGGNKLWAQVKEAYPRAEAIERERPPAGTKDWNDALRAAQERAQVQAQEQARTPGRGRAPARGTDYHDR